MANQNKTKVDTRMWKVVPLSYSEGVPSIFVRGKVAAEYIQDMLASSGHDTMIYVEGTYPEFDTDGNLS